MLRLGKTHVIKTIKKGLLWGLLFIGILCSAIPGAYADTAQENITLARIYHILNGLIPLINQAEQEQPKNARVKFHYVWLRKDVARIQKGIAQQINGPRIEPRVIKPLKEDFLTLRSTRRDT